MEKYNTFQKKLTESLPGFSVKFKNNSTLMKIIGKILFFNKTFMTNTTTTIGKTVYFPNTEYLSLLPEQSLIKILAHEFVHAADYNKHKIWFIISYLFPLICFLPFLILTIASIWISWILFVISLILCLASLTPLPAPGRKHWELRGYIANLIILNEFHKYKWPDTNQTTKQEIIDISINYYNSQFTTAKYYFMWPFGVKKQLFSYYNNKITKNNINDEIYILLINIFNSTY